MTATTREELPTHRPETGVALVGLVLAFGGAVRMLGAVGVAVVLGGVAYSRLR